MDIKTTKESAQRKNISKKNNETKPQKSSGFKNKQNNNNYIVSNANCYFNIKKYDFSQVVSQTNKR